MSEIISVPPAEPHLKTPSKPILEIREDHSVHFRSRQIGVLIRERDEIHLDIRPATLVVAGWSRRQTIALYRSLPRIIRAAKKHRCYLIGALYFTNFEKEMLGRLYDQAFALNPSIKPPKRKRRVQQARQSESEIGPDETQSGQGA